MTNFAWLADLPPQNRKTAGFVDHYLNSFPYPRLPHDDFYMRGWNEAQTLGVRVISKPFCNPRNFSHYSGSGKHTQSTIQIMQE